MDENSEFVDSLDSELSKDVGYASKPDSIDTLARMFVADKPNYARAEQSLRGAKVLTLVRTAVRSRARELHNVRAVHDGAVIDLPSVVDEFDDAPVGPDALIPSGWVMDGTTGGPSRYRLSKRVTRRGEGGAYTEVVGVAYSPVVITSSMVDVSGGASSLEIAWRHANGWSKRVVERQRLCQPREMIEALSGSHGFPANANNAKDMIAYIADYEATNEESIPKKPMTGQMGWQGDDMSLGFVSGGSHVGSGGPRVEFVGADDGEQQLARCVSTSGTLEDWANAAKITTHYPLVEAAIYAALAPPMLEILRAPNFVVDWAHKTSSGKTTTLSVAASCWGDPDPNSQKSLIASWDMTAVGFERRASALSGLPMIVDDSKRAKSFRGESAVPATIYAMTNGQGRARGSIKGMQSTSYWRTVMLSNGERRLIDFDKSGGTPARVVSLWSPPFGGNSTAIAKDLRVIKNGINKNHGHAGPALVRWLVDRRGKWDAIRSEHSSRWDAIRERMTETSSSRTPDMSVIDRMACNLAVMDVTAQAAHQAMDLPWELGDFVGAMLPIVVPSICAVDRELEAMRSVISWASANRSKFIINEKHRKEEEPHGGWLGYWDAADYAGWNCIAFFPESLKDQLTRLGHEPQSIMRQWGEAGWLRTSENGRLTSKVSEVGGRPRMIVVPRQVAESVGELSEDDGQTSCPF